MFSTLICHCAGIELDKLGNLGKNNLTFSTSYSDDDGIVCDSCNICSSSLEAYLFNPKEEKDFCVACDSGGGCNTVEITAVFETAWHMYYFSLFSSNAEVDKDPLSIALYGSNEVESWTTLLGDKSNPITSARKSSNTFFLYSLSEAKAYKTYKLKMKKKPTAPELRVGYFNIVNVLLGDYTSGIMKDLVGFQQFMPSVIKCTRGAMIGVVTDTSPNYTLKMYVKVLGAMKGRHGSIFTLTKHLKATENPHKYIFDDDRLPSIFLNPNSMKSFHCAHSVKGQKEKTAGFVLTDTKTEFLMEVVALGDQVTWKIDNALVVTLNIPLAKRIIPDKLYAFAGNNYYEAANAILRNIVYTPLAG